MKQIKLDQLVLRNFKGVRSFVLNADGADVDVFGDNATGKTTLFDGWNWLLFDKDSENKKEFEIKTLNSDGTPIHNLDHEVEATLTIEDGTIIQTVTLHKVYREKWTKKRGAVRAEFTGHTTEYFIDGVPVKKGEYEQFVSEIADEQLFRLLTDPRYFNEVLKWGERRKILLEVCGDISDVDVIAARAELAELPGILNGRTIEQHRKVVLARRKEINDELERIPVRIDEAERSKPDTEGLDEQAMLKEIETIRAQIDAKQAELAAVQNGGAIAETERRVAEIETELVRLKTELQGEWLAKIDEQRLALAKADEEYRAIESEVFALNASINRSRRNAESYRQETAKLREEWHRVNSEQFVAPELPDTCAACGQPLPADQVESARQKAEEEFNRRKSERLEQINQRGKAAKAEVATISSEIEKMEVEVAKLNQKLEQLAAAKEAESQKLAELQNKLGDTVSDPRYVAMMGELQEAKAQVTALRSEATTKLDNIRLEIAKLRNEQAMLENRRAYFDVIRQQDARIAELQEQEKVLAAEFERLERELFLLDEFTRTKVDLLESRINSKFRLARFKLFKEQINGGLEETCEVMVDGVPYNSLNNAARHNVGLDIIATLSEYFGIAAPIFLDNAESVTRPLETPGQQIRLIVSAADKQLRVEKRG